MTIGPSGAGKSTWSAEQGFEVISSDGVRVELHGSGEVPGDQSGVFRHIRTRSTQVLAKGRNVIIDAMHVEVEDRKRQSMIAPPDIGIRYVIIDRPIEDKLRDAGWRAGRGIVEKYHATFPAKVAGALNGDGRPEIEVVDLRAQAPKDGSGT
jgi:predicted kinase